MQWAKDCQESARISGEIRNSLDHPEGICVTIWWNLWPPGGCKYLSVTPSPLYPRTGTRCRPECTLFTVDQFRDAFYLHTRLCVVVDCQFDS